MENIELNLYKELTEFICKRFPRGYGGAAILYTKEKISLISIALTNANGSAGLCMETGAMCEAQKNNYCVTHSLCISRENENSDFKILSPCGICQERLMYWGNTVKVGITNKKNELRFVSLEDINPYCWIEAYADEQLESYENDNK